MESFNDGAAQAKESGTGGRERQDSHVSHSGDSSHNSVIETASIRPAPRPGPGPASTDLYRPTSHVSGVDGLEPDGGVVRANDPYWEADDEIYDRVASSRSRKAIIVAVLSFCAFLSPISSTSILAATPEVAAEYNTTGSVINASNAGYMVFMSISPIVCGPMSQVFGRRPVSDVLSHFFSSLFPLPTWPIAISLPFKSATVHQEHEKDEEAA
jgi:hypothetical protein